VQVTDEVLATMEQFADVAPAHNPPYIAAMRAFREKLPDVPQIAAFETAFHQTIPLSRQVYAIPHEWTEQLGIRRYGFHGASHRYIATRVGELLGHGKRIISCHLGGSCSICAIADGKSVANSFGMTAQSGIPHNNRVGDFDTFALLKLTKQGQSLNDIFKKLGKEGGLLGMSGVSPDMRDVEQAAADGNARAKLAIDAFVEAVRHYVGAYLVALGGCDVLAFTGGIGENGAALREAICRNLGWAGITLDPQKNNVRGKEAKISSDASKAEIWILPTNEELIVARQAQETLASSEQ
jgi:acetate kinase